MASYIVTGYPKPIEVGTRADYGTMSETNLYVKMGEGTTERSASSRTVLTQPEALELAAVLLRTVSELIAADPEA